MQIGIAGYRGAGKTTIFNCLTGARATTGYGATREPNRGVIKVPDERIDRLSALFRPKKTTYADITFVDVPPPPEGAGEGGVDKHSVPELRRMDALVHVVRAFGPSHGLRPRGGKVDPVRDLGEFDTELVLLDLVVLEGRLERLRKEGKKTREEELIAGLYASLDGGERPARGCHLDEPTRAAVTGFQLLSLKPQLCLLDFADEATPTEIATAETAVAGVATSRGIGVMSMRGNIETEIALLPADEQRAFLEDLGVTDLARTRFIRTCYRLLDLVSFFTVGEDEVRAWTIRQGTHAVQAAGKIHSDMERGFIRAETVSFEDFIPLGKLGKAREMGKLRLEGKDYVVQDGDIINVRFNV